MTTPEINQELFQKIHDQITRYPETHNQASFEARYECGTARCVAGWALAFNARKGESIAQTAARLGGHYPSSGLGFYAAPAAKLLGLTYDEVVELFFDAIDNDEAAALVELYALKGREWKDDE